MYRVPVFILMLLLAGLSLTVRAQQISPLVVETIRESTEPTTVRTGEPFTQVYKIKWIRSASWGKEVLLLEDQIKPKGFPAPLGDLEIIGWLLDDPIVTGNGETEEYSRRLQVAFRLIYPKKGEFIIPSMEIYWAIKSGDTVESQEPMKTDEILVNYVSTVTDDPYLDVREDINFGSYSRRADLFWWLSRAVFPLLALTALAAALQFMRSAKRRKTEKREDVPDKGEEIPMAAVYVPVSFSKAYKNFFRTLTRVSDNQPADRLIVKRELAGCLLAVLKSGLNLRPGDTAGEIKKRVEEKVKDGLRKTALLLLLQHLVCFEE